MTLSVYLRKGKLRATHPIVARSDGKSILSSQKLIDDQTQLRKKTDRHSQLRLVRILGEQTGRVRVPYSLRKPKLQIRKEKKNPWLGGRDSYLTAVLASAAVLARFQSDRSVIGIVKESSSRLSTMNRWPSALTSNEAPGS